ncbi:hypothetical protein CONPUDRAFT_125865 [Coniophora puteana RWD-64-598 SS2]|uniref:Uncharacterized protein n=1 Tax=Coniophora puteana (strain RWD-64-598) TaxID=741705 RepID=A0A5M3MJZ7_CONPW|nr:uncharacterized protein CONPUDRAFT_125865 [Coniophora puteana RWD-64-598 SS2]EIW79542.1 hypothetical protein CONPUDRAFT_125865 [Coniophora puteana RWD-64-598 SS2]
MTVPSPYALLPLTIFDDAWSPTNFATGWLVEGIIDENKLRTALNALTLKWRLLSGRLEKVNGDTYTKWLLRVPLGDLPPDYATFSLTSRVSEVPLSRYVTLPLPPVSPFPPGDVFIHSTMPHDSEGWAAQKAPLTFWHLTYFHSRDSSDSSPSYTCIGFTWPHGIFDGVGASLVLRALDDELHGRDWTVPFTLSEGYNENPLQRVLDDSSTQSGAEIAKYKGMCAVPWWIAIFGLLWCAWETWWLKAQYRLIVVPRNVYQRLADDVRVQLQERYGSTLEVDPSKITSSDVLTAFLFKALYGVGARPDLKINCTYFIEFRKQISTDAFDFAKFPHNSFVPLSHPITTVSSLRETSLADLAYTFARSRLSFDSTQVFSAYHFLRDLSTKKGFLFNPAHPDVDEALMVSNVSAQRIVEFDWTSLGAGRTVSSYRINSSRLPVRFSRLLSLAGRLADGSALIDGVLTERSWDHVQREFEQLITDYS